MLTEHSPESPHWFVLNYIGCPSKDFAKKTIEKFSVLHNCHLELFAPTYVVKEEKSGETKIKKVNLTFHYIFVRGTLSAVKQLCTQAKGFSFLLDRGNPHGRYATVSDREMANFKNIARAYCNCLPYFSLDEIDLEEGDLVEVINGDFPGLVGTYMPKVKGNSGNIVLHVFNNVGTIVFNVKATDVRVLEFSQKSRRANDQIDAFVASLLNALRYFHADEALPKELAAKLTVFCKRMEVARLNNRKLDAKLQGMLYGGNYILGNIEEAGAAKVRFQKLEDSITNEWTLMMLSLIFAVIERNRGLFESSKRTLSTLTAASRIQKMLVEEYDHYSSHE